MILGQRAWDGIVIMVYGREPALAMRIEQQIADAYPAGEVRIESFEDYEDALEYCKSERSVGFFFLVNDAKEPSLKNVFDNLAGPYQSTGWPVMGTLVHGSTNSGQLDAPVLLDRRLIKHAKLDLFANPTKCRELLDSVWKTFIDRTTEELLPGRTIQILSNLANKHAPAGSLTFRDKLYHLFTPRLDLSWKDHITLRWAPLLLTVEKHEAEALAQQADLRAVFCRLNDQSRSLDQISTLAADKKVPLLERTYSLISFLDIERQKGSLQQTVDTLAKLAKPAAPILLRVVKERQLDVLSLANEIQLAA